MFLLSGEYFYTFQAVWRLSPFPVKVFLEVFSGSGRLSEACGREGFTCLLWDITLGENYDLRRQEKQELILGWLRAGFLIGVHMGTPCSSFSRARDRPGGPPQLRSDAEPLGLRGLLRECDKEKVRVGNLLMWFSARLARAAVAMRVLWTLENPARSRLWITPAMRRLR